MVKLASVNSVFDSSPRATLRSLFWLRWCLLGAAVAALAFAAAGMIPLPASLWLMVAVLLVWNGYTGWRLGRDAPVSQLEVLAHLLMDAIALTVLLYGSGGAANPFVSLYLLPVAFGAVVLSVAMAWGLLLGCGTLYSLLIWRLLGEHAAHDLGFVMHILGMWANYWIAGVLIVVFVGALARRLRQREEALASARAAQMRNEQVVSLGALAAATVHELGGPLSSVDMLAESLQRESGLSDGAQEDLQLLRQQLELCRSQLDELLRDTGQQGGAANWREFLEHTVSRFRALRPEVRVELELDQRVAESECAQPQGLMLWLWGLLNNAADVTLEAGSDSITLKTALKDGNCRIEVVDAGTGLEVSEETGIRMRSSKGAGRGWGLLLGHAGIEAAGGRLEFESGHNGGTTAIMTLPMHHPAMA